MQSNYDDQYPYSITIDIPFPNAGLASIALEALRVDPELSSLVHRTLTTISSSSPCSPSLCLAESQKSIVRTHYKAKTNRVLRVALNGFMESLSVIIAVMAELNVKTLETAVQNNKQIPNHQSFLTSES
ncbi:hypothetical protein GcM3_010017 [Golovinomyces cichoracearum]|uniref:Uncharacterized protein n=1 Tax=Golovinomyces cichoracearum TaxID=62708 RepID=A0A420JA86_9PEZI|nr:hypothetical protein GcM3_010017 [Golovinomyces cichoracearum]